MRQVVLDTETTGLNAADHRIIEVGCIELVERRYSERKLHHYINPERQIEAGAEAVHGIRNADLADKPKFADIADELRAFISGAELIIHNAPFDVGFLDKEYRRLDPAHGSIGEWAHICDSLVMARKRYPGQANSLDALCKRLGVDNRGRELHGALLDARLLADVWLALTGGQVALGLETATSVRDLSGMKDLRAYAGQLPDVEISETEREAHRERLATIRELAGFCVWDTIGTNSSA
ncbi:MAG: DNA polymerase III subunit epsilon [Gammaproteobacteria bacterium]|nr:DNA polymerase III subunit epsilon [Gammaproteobacteria bacterium]